MSKLYVAVDIGCIECGEDSAVLGVFTSEAEANDVLDDHEHRQSKNWTGQHHFRLFEIDAIDTVYPVEYEVPD